MYISRRYIEGSYRTLENSLVFYFAARVSSNVLGFHVFLNVLQIDFLNYFSGYFSLFCILHATARKINVCNIYQ